jgi:hypothetical protein
LIRNGWSKRSPKISIEIILGLTIYVVSMAVVGREALKELRATLVSLSRMPGAEAR